MAWCKISSSPGTKFGAGLQAWRQIHRFGARQIHGTFEIIEFKGPFRSTSLMSTFYVRSTKPGQPAVATPPNTGTTLDMIQSFATSCGLYKENEMEASAVRLMPVLESTSRRPTLNEHCLGQQTTSEAHIVEAQQHLREHQHSRRHVWLKISWNQNLSTMHTIGVPKKKQGHRGRHLAGGPGRVSLALAAS